MVLEMMKGFLNRKHCQIGTELSVMDIIVNVWYGKMLTSLRGSIEVNLWLTYGVCLMYCGVVV